MKREIRTFRSEHFAVRIERWWWPKDRKAARLALKFAERDHEAIFQETTKQWSRGLLFGESFVRKDWKA